ncbi:hypothetical protein N9A28_03695 [Sulfurimonas sp.]|nr:hypothetical protein [Sulfurimonas sp.]
MRKLLLLIFTCSLVFSSSIYTLDNVKNLNIYFDNKSGFLDNKNKEDINKLITKELTSAGFIFGKTDAIIFFVKVKAKELDETYFINVELGLAEEVITKREGSVETFAHTYIGSELIESEEPYTDTVELIEYLLHEFIESYKDDNEE